MLFNKEIFFCSFAFTVQPKQYYAWVWSVELAKYLNLAKVPWIATYKMSAATRWIKSFGRNLRFFSFHFYFMFQDVRKPIMTFEEELAELQREWKQKPAPNGCEPIYYHIFGVLFVFLGLKFSSWRNEETKFRIRNGELNIQVHFRHNVSISRVSIESITTIMLLKLVEKMTLKHDFKWKMHSLWTGLEKLCVWEFALPQWTKQQQKTATWTVEVEPWASPKCKQSDTVEIISSFKCSLKRIIKKTSRGKCSIFLLISAQSYSKRIKSAEISQCLVQLSLNEHYLLFFSAVYLCVM